MTDAAEVAGADAARPAARTWRTPVVQTSILLPIAIALGSLLAGAIYTWFVGEDVNWDWMNYHEYNVWAVINGRYGIDAMPAGFQTYFNPVVYFPIYYLRHLLPLPYGMMIMGAVHGLNLLLIYFLVRVLLRQTATVECDRRGDPDRSGGADDAFGGRHQLLRHSHRASHSRRLRPDPVGRQIESRALCPRRPSDRRGRRAEADQRRLCIGAAAAVLAAGRPLLATLCLGIGGAAGALATGGAWSLMLWREFGNPVFPMFNAVFRSPELMAANIMDWQFLPRGLLDALAYPFYWLVGDNRSSEYPFRDARFAVATVLIVLGIGRGLVTRTDIFTRRDTQFLLFFGVSYAAWLAVFAIQRYAVVLELLCAPLIVLLIARVMAGIPGSVPRRVASPRLNAAMLVAAVAIALWSQPGDWFRRPWSSPYQPAISKSLEQPANYLLLDKPLAYIAPLLPPQSRFYLIADIALPVMPDGKFDRRIRTALQDPPPGGNWGLHTRDKPIREPLLERYGLRVDASRPCVEIEGAWLGTAVEACPLVARAK